MMPHQRGDQPSRLGAARDCVLERVVASAVAALIRFLARVQLGVDEESVLEVVDPDLRGFRISYRAQMASNFHAMLVRLLHGGAQLLAGDVLVCLE